MIHEGKGHLGFLSGLADDQHRLLLIQVLERLLFRHASKGALGPDVLRHRLQLVVDGFDHILGVDESVH